MTIAEMLGDDGRAALLDARVHLPALQRCLERYLEFGGLPAAVAEAIAGAPGPTEDVQRMVKEVQRRGATMPATQALLDRIMRSLGSKVSWNRMAQEMDVPLSARTRRRSKGVPANDRRTLQGYVEFLAVNYFALIVYFWKPDTGTSELYGARDSIEAVEVADWDRLNRQKATAPMRALPHRPAIVATRRELEFGATAKLVPAAMLLWGLSA